MQELATTQFTTQYTPHYPHSHDLLSDPDEERSLLTGTWLTPPPGPTVPDLNLRISAALAPPPGPAPSPIPEGWDITTCWRTSGRSLRALAEMADSLSRGEHSARYAARLADTVARLSSHIGELAEEADRLEPKR